MGFKRAKRFVKRYWLLNSMSHYNVHWEQKYWTIASFLEIRYGRYEMKILKFEILAQTEDKNAKTSSDELISQFFT